MTEEWRKIEGFPDYMVSNEGRVCSMKRNMPVILKAGNNSYGYLKVTLYSKTACSKNVHRVVANAFILNIANKPEVNHKDGNGFNNRRSNLRTCNQTQNLGNSKIPKTNKTGYKGVYTTENSQKPRTCPFMSKIQFQKKHIHIGYYMTAEEAARAYDQKAKELFGEFAKTNF